MADAKFRTVAGIIEFPPKDGDAGGKPVRNITISQTGFGVQSIRVYATVWPSHKHVELNEGDFVVIRGKYNPNTTTKDGEKVTYHNISVLGIRNLGPLDFGKKPETESEPEPEDDEIPF